jgi:hypothetical protein
MEKHNTWIRVAGNASNIKGGHPHGWQCFFEGSLQQIPLKGWFVSGSANAANFIPGFSAQKDEHGLVAWIDCYGSCIVDEYEVLHISLQNPPA